MPKLASGIAMMGEHHVDGENAEEIAAKHQIPVKRAYADMSTSKSWLSSNWRKVGAGIACGFMILLLLIRLRDDDNRYEMSASRARFPEPEIPLPLLPPHPEAPALRGRALSFCHQKQYEWCLEYLNHARRIDLAGEQDPEVMAARQDAERRVRE
jgi:hypothetical protein